MARVYVGNLPTDIKEKELDDLFYKYGRIREIDIKTPARPPAFAFITFADYRDAEDAIRGRDNYNFDGYRLRCEFAKGDRRAGGRDARDDHGPPRRTAVGGRRTDFGVVVSNLPKGCSWQDLKDFMRKAGDVVYTDVDKYNDGVVEFSNKEDMENAVRDLDDTEFKNYNESSYIRVRLANSSKKTSSSHDRAKRSPSRSRSRDRKRSSPAPRSRSGSEERPSARKRTMSNGDDDTARDRDRDRERERERDREDDR